MVGSRLPRVVGAGRGAGSARPGHQPDLLEGAHRTNAWRTKYITRPLSPGGLTRRHWRCNPGATPVFRARART